MESDYLHLRVGTLIAIVIHPPIFFFHNVPSYLETNNSTPFVYIKNPHI